MTIAMLERNLLRLQANFSQQDFACSLAERLQSKRALGVAAVAIGCVSILALLARR